MESPIVENLKFETEVWNYSPSMITRLANLILVAIVPMPQLFVWLLVINLAWGVLHYLIAPVFHRIMPLMLLAGSIPAWIGTIGLAIFFLVKGQWWMSLYVFGFMCGLGLFFDWPAFIIDGMFVRKYQTHPKNFYFGLRMQAMGLIPDDQQEI